MLWASFFCTVDGLTTVYFINNEVDHAVNEIMHQLQYQASYNKDRIYERINYRSSTVNQACVNTVSTMPAFIGVQYFFIDSRKCHGTTAACSLAPIAPHHPVRGSF